MTGKNRAIFIFVFIAGLSLLLFQNCSSSLFAIGAGKSAQANDLSEMIAVSKKEISITTKVLHKNSGSEKIFERRQASEDSPGAYEKDNVSIKLKHKSRRKYASTFKKGTAKKNKQKFKQKFKQKTKTGKKKKINKRIKKKVLKTKKRKKIKKMKS